MLAMHNLVSLVYPLQYLVPIAVRTIAGPSPLRASKVLQWSMSVEDIISVCVAYYRVGGNSEARASIREEEKAQRLWHLSDTSH